MMKRSYFSADNRPWYRQLVKLVVIACNFIVALSMLLGGLTLWIGPEVLSYLSCLGLAFPILVVCNILFVLFWLFMRDVWCLLSLSLLLILYVPIKYTFCFNPGKPSEVSGESISVLSYNTMTLGRFAPHKQGNPNAILAYIVQESPDIVCLQEFGVAKSGNNLRMSDVKSALRDYPYSHIEYTTNTKRKSVGIATFSKYPIVRRGNLGIDSRFNVVIFSDVVVDGDTVRVYNCHLESNKLTPDDVQAQSDLIQDFDTHRASVYAGSIVRKLSAAYRLRATQARQVAKSVSVSPYPVLLCGDFNDVPSSFAYNTIRRSKKLVDAFVERGNGLGLTYQHNLIHVRIDYIMHDDYFCAVECGVGKEGTSDHYPVYSRLYRKTKL